MKKAYILTIYNQIDHANMLIDLLMKDGTSDVYVHLDKKRENLKSGIKLRDGLFFVENNQNIEWGGWSFMIAIYESWKQVVRTGKYDYVILCSGQDMLLRSDLDQFLEINSQQIFIDSWEQDKIRRAYLLHKWPHFYFRIINTKWSVIRFLRVLRLRLFIWGLPICKRKVDYNVQSLVFYKNWFWSVIPGDVIEWIVNYIDDNPNYLDVFKGYVAEEGFIATSIMISPYKNWLRFDEKGKSHSLTYRKPSVNNHPPVLGGADIQAAEKSGCFFARKIDIDLSKDFINYFIEKMERQNKQ